MTLSDLLELSSCFVQFENWRVFLTKEAGVGLFALVLADCPPAGQSKLLKKLVHLSKEQV